VVLFRSGTEMKGGPMRSREQNIERVNAKIGQISDEMSRSRRDLNKCRDLEARKDQYHDVLSEVRAAATDEEAQVAVVSASLAGLTLPPEVSEGQRLPPEPGYSWQGGILRVAGRRAWNPARLIKE
jgi:hypothetical protein